MCNRGRATCCASCTFGCHMISAGSSCRSPGAAWTSPLCSRAGSLGSSCCGCRGEVSRNAQRALPHSYDRRCRSHLQSQRIAGGARAGTERVLAQAAPTTRHPHLRKSEATRFGPSEGRVQRRLLYSLSFQTPGLVGPSLRPNDRPGTTLTCENGQDAINP